MVTSHIQFAIFNRYSDDKEIILNMANVISIIPTDVKDSDQLDITFTHGYVESVVGRIKEIKNPLGIRDKPQTRH